MKYSGASIVTTHQVGATVFIIEDDVPVEAIVKATYTSQDGAEAVVNNYELEGYSKIFSSAEIYSSVANMKTAFEDLADAL